MFFCHDATEFVSRTRREVNTKSEELLSHQDIVEQLEILFKLFQVGN